LAGLIRRISTIPIEYHRAKDSAKEVASAVVYTAFNDLKINPDSRFFIKRSQAKKPSRLNRNHFPAYFAYRFLVPHDVKNTKDLQFWCELAEIPTDCLKEEALRRWERWNEKFVAMKQKYGLR